MIFKKYSGKLTLPGKKKFMSLEEFRSLCNDAGLVGEKFATREIDVCFSSAKMSEVDEIYNKKHMEMSFVEMLEAVSRAIDAAELKKLSSSNLSSVIQTDLSKKIEMALFSFIKLCPLSFQDDYEFPTVEAYKKLMYK